MSSEVFTFQKTLSIYVGNAPNVATFKITTISIGGANNSNSAKTARPGRTLNARHSYSRAMNQCHRFKLQVAFHKHACVCISEREYKYKNIRAAQQ